MAESEPAVRDLTRDAGFLQSLLDDTWSWRHRRRDVVRLDNPRVLDVVTTFQIEFPQSLLGSAGVTEAQDRVRALLPVTTRPKQTLVEYELLGEDGVAVPVLPRRSIAALQAGYLRQLAETSPGGALVARGLPEDLLEAVGLYLPRRFEQLRETEDDELQALAHYLREEMPFVSQALVQQWCWTLSPVRHHLGLALDEPDRLPGASECILLALPYLTRVPESRWEVDQLIFDYSQSVLAAVHAPGGADRDLLLALADYGRNWEMIAEIELPLWRPSTLTFKERRPLNVTQAGRITIGAPIADAASYHLQARVDDLAVEICGQPLVLDLYGRAPAQLEDLQWTRERMSLYESRREQPDALQVHLQLAPAAAVALTYRMVEALTWLAVLLALAAPVAPDALSLVLLPATFAVPLLLLREQSRLAARLLEGGRRRTVAALALLWLVVAVRLLASTEASSPLLRWVQWVGERF